MSDSFERYAVTRIQHLRDQAARLSVEAEALENALRAYRANGGAASQMDTPAVPIAPSNLKPGRLQTGSQAHNVLATMEAAGAEGRVLPDIYKALAEKGITNTNSIRSVVWTLKKGGKIVARGDRYYAASYAPQ